MTDGNKYKGKFHATTDKKDMQPKAISTVHKQTEGIVTNEQDELLDAINPYPTGHTCAKLYDVFLRKGEKNICLKMRKNIKVNAQMNIEIGDREYTILKARADNKKIKERDGKIFFIDDADKKEAQKQGWALLKTQQEMLDFINAFPSTDNQLISNAGNMIRSFNLYTPGLHDGFWNGHDKERQINGQTYVVLCEGKCGVYVYVDHITKKRSGDTFIGRHEDGYQVIVSRPIQKK